MGGGGGGGFQITKSYLLSDKYRSEVALKIDTVKIEVSEVGFGNPPPGYAPVILLNYDRNVLSLIINLQFLHAATRYLATFSVFCLNSSFYFNLFFAFILFS